MTTTTTTAASSRMRHRRAGAGGGGTDEHGGEKEVLGWHEMNLDEDYTNDYDDDHDHEGHRQQWWKTIHRFMIRRMMMMRTTMMRARVLLLIITFSMISWYSWRTLTLSKSTNATKMRSRIPGVNATDSMQLPFTQTARIPAMYSQSINTTNELGKQEIVDLDCERPYLRLPLLNLTDPFLPWIHDYFVTETEVRFVAQNKRRCETGRDKGPIMAYWEPQMALFQPISVVLSHQNNNEKSSRRFENNNNHHHDDGDNGSNDDNIELHLTDPEHATHPETRFVCRFHRYSDNHHHHHVMEITMSKYPFNYEYIHWRKRGNDKPMFVKRGPDVEWFDFATLLFSCPIPESFQQQQQQHRRQQSSSSSLLPPQPQWWLDLIPLRVPARYDEGFLLTKEQVGPAEFAQLRRFNTTTSLKYNSASQNTNDHDRTLIPPIDTLGRYENLPLCPVNGGDAPVAAPKHDDASPTSQPQQNQQPYNLVACTWAAASYQRRGIAGTVVDDAPARLYEWLQFHRLVGFQHVYVYDNTPAAAAVASNPKKKKALPTTTLQSVTDLFPSDFVTYIPWPAVVCSNGFIGGRHPGERSSQYAAEASCRERYGPTTRWMAFFDMDEYLIPLLLQPPERDTSTASWINVTTWQHLLNQKHQEQKYILAMKSSRALPRAELMEAVSEPRLCQDPKKGEDNEKEESTQRGLSDTEVNSAASDASSSSLSCWMPHSNETYLHVYNCDVVRPPRPHHYFTNMKQMYQPAFVLSHFVHYSVITKRMAMYYKDYYSANPSLQYTRKLSPLDKGLTFLDELTEGVMLHARSILPHETTRRTTACQLHSNETCMVGVMCPDSTRYRDQDVNKNVFQDEQGRYCNCWINHHVEEQLVPALQHVMQQFPFPRAKP